MKVTVKRAAELLGVSKSLVYALVASGQLPSYRVGIGRGTIRIEEEAVEAAKKEVAAKGSDALAAGLKHLALG